MFTFSGFTNKANKSLNISIAIASDLGHTYIGSEHILYGLIAEKTSIASTILNKKNIYSESVRKFLEKYIGIGVKSKLTSNDFTPRSKEILENAVKNSKILNHTYVGTEHILLAILKDKNSCASTIMSNMGIDIDELYHEIISEISFLLYTKEIKDKQVSNSILTKYSKDLTEMSKTGLIDPVIGRKKEIDRVIQILSRRTKNNPCLIGEAGVGKTAIAEGLAENIIKGEVPNNLINKKILSLDLTSMLAGTKYRGDFEERIKSFINEVIKEKNIILFIDEIHSIMGAGSSEGAIDAANILKPQLARGEIQIIGATTFDEYKKNIEKDSALDRRFQSIIVNEPTKEEAIKIIKGIKNKYESHHKIKISEEAIEASVELSSRYIMNRFLPDKAIDLIDEAASKVSINNEKKPLVIKEYEKYLKDLKNDKLNALNNKNLVLASQIREKEKDIIIKLEEENKIWKDSRSKIKLEIKKDDISEVISNSTGIPIKKLNQTDSNRLLNLEEKLNKRIIGQDDAVNKIAKSIRRSRIGLNDPGRPIGSFIFLGPTGVGKTELCKALAEALFENDESIIRLDMSEYMEKNSVSKIIGSPPGYIGFEDGGQLTEKVKRNPYSIILFDEIEKAHPDIFNILLQILDDGILTDTKGKVVNFKNTIIIMTSNIGADYITNENILGFNATKEDISTKLNNNILYDLKKYFRPEFINRIDDIIIFKKLNKENIIKISEKMLDILKKKVLNLGIDIKISQSTILKIADKGFDEKYGARPLRKEIIASIEDKLAEHLIKGEFKKNDKILIDYINNEFIFNRI